MAINQRNGSWQWDRKLAGWEKRKRHTFKTLAEAEAHDLQTLADHKLGKPYRAPVDTDVKASKANSIEELVEHVNKVQWSLQTSARREGQPWHMHPQYRSARLFAEWIGPNTSVQDALTADKIDEYVAWRRREKGNSTVTIKHHLSAISTLLDRAVARRHCEVRFRMTKQPKVAGEGTERKVFDPHQEAQIRAVTDRLGAAAMLDLWIVLRKTAIRPIELGKIPWSDIGETRITVHKSIAKNKSTRHIPLFAEARDAIERMRTVHGFGDAPGPFDWIRGKRYRKVTAFWNTLRSHLSWLAEDPGYVPYSFRHTCISEWANDRRVRGAHIWAGHTLAVHNSYVHQIDSRDDFAELVAEFSKAA